ncbi:MAG: CBS domain-containing protein [Spirochaetes bacterium]|nr:CBS domain-containing protein [Spirochaetota bacterium]
MSIVRDILNEKKQKETWSISPKATVLKALKLMKEKKIGALIVMNDKGKVAGIFSERDYVRKISLRADSPGKGDTLVEKMMTPAKKMYTVTPDSSIDDCMALMTEKHIRHLPVFENNKFIGIISIGDTVKSIIAEKEDVIANLSDYIAGKYS